MSEESTYVPRVERRKWRRAGFGIILILLGGLFLLQQVTNFRFENWWALFILIPAFGSLSTALVIYQKTGRFNEGVRSSLGGALIILTVAFIFLLDLSWRIWWPMMLIIPGLNLLSQGFPLPGSREAELPLANRLYRPWLGWVGLAVMLLGAGFLAKNLDLFNPGDLLNRWWALIILVPAVGGVVTWLRLAVQGQAVTWAGMTTIFNTVIFAAVGLIALLGIDWNILTPVLIIAAGLIILLGVFRR